MSGSKPLTTREKTKLNQNIANDPLVGQVIGGHYEVLECIGKGGMSVVYKTRHQLINQLRAVKILLPHRDAASDFLLRFQLEATAASRLDNPHIVRIHDFVSPPDTAPYLVMDFAEGIALGDEIDRLGHIPVPRALFIFRQLLEAIGHTHKRGVIHRDLKPDNILLIEDEVEGSDFVKLIDFGIAKLTAADKLQPQGLTPTGEVFGSPQYMSPEQCAGLTMDVRSEIYSLGCMLYEMLSGRAPLLGKSVLETLNMQAHVDATPVSNLPIDPPIKLPRGLDDIVMKCLAKKPADRYQNTEELDNALEKINVASYSRDGRDSKHNYAPGFNQSRRTSKINRSKRNPSMAVPILASAILSFGLGFALAKILETTGGGSNFFGLSKNAGNRHAAITAGTQTSTGDIDDSSTSSADLSRWQSLSDAGQRDLDSGDLAASASQLQEALTVANSLNDGQKHSAATGFDLGALEIIKQFKNSRPNEVDKTVIIPQDYPNHPWETKVSALAQILREKPISADDEKAIFRSTIELLEDSHKGNLSSLNGILNLANENIAAYTSLSARDRLRLAIAISGVQNEQGFTAKARAGLKKFRAEVDGLGTYDPITARFYLLDGKLALHEKQYDEATSALNRAETIDKENTQEHGADLLEIAMVRSDIALAQDHTDDSLNTARQALASAREWKIQPGGSVEATKNKLSMRVASLDSTHYLAPAIQQGQRNLEEEELAIPKNVGQLISALTIVDGLTAIKGGAPAASTRPMLWRAMALAFASGRLAETSALIQPLLISYDTPLTQKELVRLASNRLTIDQTLATAGNDNGQDLLEDYVVLAEALEDFSLGPARDLKKARGYLDAATKAIVLPENRKNRLLVARIYLYQARCARERKALPDLVLALLGEAKQQLAKITYTNAARQNEHTAALELLKRINEMSQEEERTKVR